MPSRISSLHTTAGRRPITPPAALPERRHGSFTPPLMVDYSAGTPVRRSSSAADATGETVTSSPSSISRPLLASPPPGARYTVVVDLDETLVYARPQVTKGRVWPRPGVELVLNALRNKRPQIDAVAWTAADVRHAGEVLSVLHDKVPGVFSACITRETPGVQWFTVAGHTKDIRLLGRDEGTVLLVENTPDCVRPNKGASILVSDYDPSRSDHKPELSAGAMEGLARLIEELSVHTGSVADLLKQSKHVAVREAGDPGGNLQWETMASDLGSFEPPISATGNRDLFPGRNMPALSATPVPPPNTPPRQYGRREQVFSTQGLSTSPGQPTPRYSPQEKPVVPPPVFSGETGRTLRTRSPSSSTRKVLPRESTTLNEPRTAEVLHPSKWMKLTVGMDVEAKDLYGKWWTVRITGNNNDEEGTYTATVYDAEFTYWSRVHPANCRPIPNAHDLQQRRRESSSSTKSPDLELARYSRGRPLKHVPCP